MASSGESFVGKWNIQEWYDDPPKNLPGWLVKVGKDGEGAYLTITETRGGYSLQWPDTDGNICTITPPLAYSKGELHGGSNITIEKKVSIPLPGGAGAAFESNKLIVSLIGGIVDGEPGTFTAEAHPREEEHQDHRRSPGWLRWLRRLIQRRR